MKEGGPNGKKQVTGGLPLKVDAVQRLQGCSLS